LRLCGTLAGYFENPKCQAKNTAEIGCQLVVTKSSSDYLGGMSFSGRDKSSAIISSRQYLNPLIPEAEQIQMRAAIIQYDSYKEIQPRIEMLLTC